MIFKEFPIFALALIFLFNSCEKKEEVNAIPKSHCENQTEFHFSGIIDGNQKCFNTGQYNYQRYSGTSSLWNEGAPIFGRYVLGMDTFPVNEGDEHIFLYTPLVTLNDPEKIDSLFQKRILSIDEMCNYRIRYDIVTQAENGVSVEKTRLNAQFDNDSSMEVVYFKKIINSGSITFKVTLSFNCNLYDNSGFLSGAIISGELAGTIVLDL